MIFTTQEITDHLSPENSNFGGDKTIHQAKQLLLASDQNQINKIQIKLNLTSNFFINFIFYNFLFIYFYIYFLKIFS